MTYCISDIHGEYDLFMRLLEKVRFSHRDRLIVCGDLIDKGKASVRLLKAVSKMPNVQAIKGNHEFDFFKFYRTRMHSAIADDDAILWHLQQYFPEEQEKLDWETVSWLVQLPYYLENKQYICVHAGAPMDGAGRILPLEEAECESLVYDRRFCNPEVQPKESKCVLFGHTPTVYLQQNPEILKYAREGRKASSRRIAHYTKVHLDTGVSLSRTLGIFCIDTCKSTYVSDL